MITIEIRDGTDTKIFSKAYYVDWFPDKVIKDFEKAIDKLFNVLEVK